MTKLTTHFSLEELTASSLAIRLGIDNTPNSGVIANLQALALGLEQILKLTKLHNTPLDIHSGYRGPALNKAVRGAKTSAHLTGYAADFTSKAVSPIEIAQAIAESQIKFDQLIYEGNWVHISFDPKMRGKILTARFSSTGVTYLKGIVHG